LYSLLAVGSYVFIKVIQHSQMAVSHK